jgi:thiamine-monophosphate kinase
MRTVSDIGERALVDLIRARVPPAPESVIVGIGDDAAVVEPVRGMLTVLTTDALVEGIHFDRAFASAADVGHKALAVNLSDIAAMGGRPSVALLSLALPDGMAAADVEALVDALVALAAAHHVALVGGNITRSPGPLVVDVTLTGAVHRRRILRRGGARAGDELFVSGMIGGAAAGLAWLRAGRPAGPAALGAAAIRYLRPEPRVRLGLLVGRGRAASACVDLSDGLADGVRQIAGASGTGAFVEADAVPIDEGARAWFGARGVDALDAALAGGEDYELLVAVPRRLRGRFRAAAAAARGVRLTRIGALTAEPAIRLRRGGVERPLPTGFQHFTEGTGLAAR